MAHRKILVCIRRFRLRARIGRSVTSSDLSPHRPERAELLHSVPQTNSPHWHRIPRAGDTRAKQRMSIEKVYVLSPGQRLATSPSIEPLVPEPTDFLIERR